MSEGEFWVKFWSIVAATILGVIAMLIVNARVSDHVEKSALTAMVEAGANPVEARCSLTGWGCGDLREERFFRAALAAARGEE